MTAPTKAEEIASKIVVGDWTNNTQHITGTEWRELEKRIVIALEKCRKETVESLVEWGEFSKEDVDKARAEGYRQAIEDAAKICERLLPEYLQHTVEHIRALSKDK